MEQCTDGWVDGRVVGGLVMDGLVDRRMEAWMSSRRMGRLADGNICNCGLVDGWMDRWMDGSMEWMDGADGADEGCVDVWTE